MIRTYALVFFITLLSASFSAPSYAEIEGLYQKTGFANDSIVQFDESGSESIDTFTGRLTLSYRDAVIPGDGGFNLPIVRRYQSIQTDNIGFVDPTNDVFGYGWDIHFGRIRYAQLGLFCDGSFFNVNTNGNPSFEDPEGNSHLLLVTNDITAPAGDMTSEANTELLL